MQGFESRSRGPTGTGAEVGGGATTALVAAVIGDFVGTSFVEVETAAITFESLAHQSEQHLATEVTESGRFVGMDLERVWSDVDLIRRTVGCDVRGETA